MARPSPEEPINKSGLLCGCFNSDLFLSFNLLASSTATRRHNSGYVLANRVNWYSGIRKETVGSAAITVALLLARGSTNAISPTCLSGDPQPRCGRSCEFLTSPLMIKSRSFSVCPCCIKTAFFSLRSSFPPQAINASASSALPETKVCDLRASTKRRFPRLPK